MPVPVNPDTDSNAAFKGDTPAPRTKGRQPNRDTTSQASAAVNMAWRCWKAELLRASQYSTCPQARHTAAVTPSAQYPFGSPNSRQTSMESKAMTAGTCSNAPMPRTTGSASDNQVLDRVRAIRLVCLLFGEPKGDRKSTQLNSSHVARS